MPTYTFRGNRAELRILLGTIPAILAGRHPDTLGVAQAVQLRMGNAMLSQLRQDFLVKSRGGTGRDGIKWAPLSPYTIARRRTTPGELKSLGVKKGPLGFLTPGEHLQWQKIFGRWFNILKAKGYPDDKAKAQAGKVAWTEMKKRGAKTKIGVLGSRTVDIGRDTSRMFDSLAAGFDAAPPPGATTTFIPGSVVIGTNVEYFRYFHYGTSRQPARPVAPPDGSIPDAWWPAVMDAGVTGLVRVVEEMLGRG